MKRDGAFAFAVERVKEIDPEIERKVISGVAPPKATVIRAAQSVARPPGPRRGPRPALLLSETASPGSQS